MNHNETINLLVAIGIMLLAGRLLGEFFRKLKMPLVVGELLAGICLGPSLLGKYFPQLNEVVFTTQGHVGLVLNGISTVSVIMLLFAAGMEVEFSVIRQQSKTALKTSFVGLISTLTLGYFSGNMLFPYFGDGAQSSQLVFSLFFATAMAITALPVIARTLMDLDLFKTKIGMIIIAAAMFDDVIGWILFSVVLGMMHSGTSSYEFLNTLGLTLLYAVVILTAGRILINKSLPWAQRNLSWPGGVLAFSLGFAFLGAAFTEKIGIHAIFGAFIMGIAIGDSAHLNEKTRDIIHQFITNIFAPLFFVFIGFKVDFIANFDLVLVLIVTGIAVVTKLLGAGLGALWGKLTVKQALAVGFGMNARGAMEIVLGLLALQAGLITLPLFVALVVMAVLTSILAGPMLKYLLTGEIKLSVKLSDILPVKEGE
ncbi:MAG: cation:proton antiporter [Bacteroidota bacterium]|jgi:Kef-type K+ transport system membrane component KefB|nr:cation:proton antiporter [Sphingobacteriales bacterium]